MGAVVLRGRIGMNPEVIGYAHLNHGLKPVVMNWRLVVTV
jgi:hypothetical protein